MSEFDKEAEREKLREQFAEDEDRADTQRMSELLLKGATMTNRHCDNCGDPIFRWEGDEFCPSCSAGEAAGTEGSAQAAGDSSPAEGGAPAGATESASTGANATVGADAPAGANTDTPDSTPSNATNPNVNSNESPDAARAASGRSTDAGATPAGASDAGGVSPEDFASVGDDASAGTDAGARRPPAGGQEAPPAGSQPAQMADLGAARASLSRTVTRFAQEAERADDLARAREYLDAVADAADALTAVRRAER